jgi:hypothetical protein
MGRLAQLVRAPALQAGGRRFESCTAHQCFQSVRNYLGVYGVRFDVQDSGAVGGASTFYRLPLASRRTWV